jgi:hypothetical protein
MMPSEWRVVMKCSGAYSYHSVYRNAAIGWVCDYRFLLRTVLNCHIMPLMYSDK